MYETLFLFRKKIKMLKSINPLNVTLLNYKYFSIAQRKNFTKNNVGFIRGYEYELVNLFFCFEGLSFIKTITICNLSVWFFS